MAISYPLLNFSLRASSCDMQKEFMISTLSGIPLRADVFPTISLTMALPFVLKDTHSNPSSSARFITAKFCGMIRS